ncbi:MAG: flagellar basal-body MS-ring/collar protein FliF [Acidobacteriota bacterium]|nr:flagellar basal-body MS-ring/collar protein FliF [Acidobacteriota bacterium]MDQ7087453.1 flagellar basal-body MS-ring/collar protein FliF [Acidobacteriota bacterium]
MNEILQQISQAWASLSLRQRISLVLSAGMTVAAVGGIVWWAQQPTWTVLYTGLDGKEAQEIVQELQAAKVPLRLSDGGTTIEVPYEKIDQARIDLAAKNLPQSGRFGFIEMFQGDSFAQSNRMHQVRLQRALEDELARTIESLDEVRTARVHLVLPGERVFLDDDDVAKASVTLAVARGGRIAAENVQAIARIVAGAVPELDIEHVSVVDTNGHVLWEGDGEGGGGSMAAFRQVEMKNAVESDINRKVAKVLQPLVGQDRFIVRTTADLDLTRSVRKERQYDPDRGVLVSEQKSKKKSSSGGAGARGVPGTASNLPGAAAGGASARSSSESETRQTNSYEYSVVEKQVEEPTGRIKRISVAVLVDQTWVKGEEDEAAQPVPRSDEEMARIEQLVKAAISFDEARGDVVTVEQSPFRITEPVIEEPGFDPRSWLPLLKYPSLVLLLLLVFLLFYRPMLKTVQQVLPAVGSRGGTSPGSEASANLEQQFQLGPPSQLEVLRQRLAALAAEQPEGMAQTMRVWLHETEE